MVFSSVYLQDNLMSQIGLRNLPHSGGVAKSQNARMPECRNAEIESRNTKTQNHQNKALDQ